MSCEEKDQQIESAGSNFKNCSNKFKSYLIEKLLNESPSSYKMVPVSCEDKEDVVSETGTYTIEDDLMNSKKNIDIEIDEKFGISRPDIDQSIQTTPQRHTKIIRERNQTYSLGNDIADQSYASSGTSSSHSITKLTKTNTYNLITDAKPDSGRTIATNVLLGDTENLMKEIRRQDDMSSSSASSSSTNLSNENKTKFWSTPSESCSPTQTQTKKTNLECVSTRATVDYDGKDNEEDSMPKKNLAFEFSLTSDNKFVSKNLSKKESPATSSRSDDSKLTISKGYEMRKNRRDMANSVSSSISYNSPKSNATSKISLGARIQEKAKENMSTEPKRRVSDSTAPANIQYTNRTLYLRQQSAKAKRDSLDKKPKESILKKPVTPLSRNSSLSRSTTITKSNSKPSSVKKTTSRNVSPCDNSLIMTSSLNLPNRSSLPDSFQRRKMYDPAKSVQADRDKKFKELENNKKLLQNNSANDFNDFDSMSESSYNSLPHQQIDNSNQVFLIILFYIQSFHSLTK